MMFTEMIEFLDECDESKVMKEPSVECGPLTGWSPVSVQLLEGAWFFAADINADPKIYIQSAVVELTANGTGSDMLNIRFFALRESDSRCIGPGKGTVQLHRHNSTITVQVQYHYDSLPELRNSYIRWQSQILYVDNLRMLLYWCFKRAANGSCVQYDVDILVRTRHLAHHDLALLEPYLKMACVHHDQLRWFDLHSRCGLDMSQSTKLRRTIMTLSHREVLDILTNVQEPRCKKDQLKGIRVDLSVLEKAGKWLLISRYDHFEFVTYAMIGRIRVIESGKAIVKVFQSAARPGSQKRCYQRMFMLAEDVNDDDFIYRLYFESLLGSKSFMVLRFLFMNRHVGVIHSCLSYKKNGECDENFLYVISRHDSIDHTELSVLETVANSVCIPVEHLVHMALHDDCIHENRDVKLVTVPCSAISLLPQPPNGDEIIQQLQQRFKNNTYFAIASSSLEPKRFILKFNDGYVKKIYESHSRCYERDIRLYAVKGNEMLVVVNDDELVLLSPFAFSSPLVIQSAQYSGEFPCLLPIHYDAYNMSSITTQGHGCEELKPHNCTPPPISLDPSKMNGVWVLQEALHQTVANLRCEVTNTSDEYRKRAECVAEREELLSGYSLLGH
uniref:Lipocalin/cytosolic fatty-acid binding domain-containing protein n=1 Tax=Parascaris univalens TaxID=6257 RepID=A0A915CCD1_PARUN